MFQHSILIIWAWDSKAMWYSDREWARSRNKISNKSHLSLLYQHKEEVSEACIKHFWPVKEIHKITQRQSSLLLKLIKLRFRPLHPMQRKPMKSTIEIYWSHHQSQLICINLQVPQISAQRPAKAQQIYFKVAQANWLSLSPKTTN